MKKRCFMRGFLSFLVLKLISKRSMSGNDIRRELARRRGSNPSCGTIYPVLKQLSRIGLITKVKGNNRDKKYRLTPIGHAEVRAATRKFCQLFFDMKEEFDRFVQKNI